MSKEQKQTQSKVEGVIPEWRFPEFEKDGEWEEKKLGAIGEPLMCKRILKDQTTPNSKNAIPFYKIGTFGREADSYIPENLYNVYRAKYSYPKVGEILISASGTIGRLVIYDGSPAYYQDSNIVWLGHNEDLVLNSFLFYCYAILTWQTSDGGVIKRLYNSDLKNIKIHFPENKKEQQKIAFCLSPLDELIAAHNDKLQALKEHEKGLMQNLFPPANGSHCGPDPQFSRIPIYRFPEFEKDGEWELCPFSNFIKLYRGSSPRPIREYLTNSENGVNWIKIGDTSSVNDYIIRSVTEKITPKGAEKSRKVKKGELILANSMSYGKTYQLELDGCIYDGWFVLREYEEVFDKQFLLQLLNSNYMQGQYKKFAAGGIVQNISSEIVYSTLLPKTSKPEQQKIASCLTALDALITAQAERIEQLQLHKKGLMQGLFPSL